MGHHRPLCSLRAAAPCRTPCGVYAAAPHTAARTALCSLHWPCCVNGAVRTAAAAGGFFLGRVGGLSWPCAGMACWGQRVTAK